MEGSPYCRMEEFVVVSKVRTAGAVISREAAPDLEEGVTLGPLGKNEIFHPLVPLTEIAYRAVDAS